MKLKILVIMVLLGIIGVVSIACSNPTLPNPQENATVQAKAYLPPGMIEIKYNRKEAVNYALNNYNDEVHSEFPFKGNDCAHFVSRCLYAGGGIPMTRIGSLLADGTPPWWYKKSGSYGSNFWNGAKSYYQAKFLTKFFGKSLLTTPVNEDILSGNPVYYDWDGDNEYDHVAICTASGTKNKTAQVCAHNPAEGKIAWNSLKSPNGTKAKKFATIQLPDSVVKADSDIKPYKYYPYSF